ncbi:MAG: HNH endonuclease [Candidatus Marinimicrobia bacterium]|nr:HNH endonuclease [Candidatus Neomarinimicrobiota bacterium]|tara:strand:- start:3246 stop:4172 length:927 start_codon:yes stop_codon:yes gene_type:complete
MEKYIRDLIDTIHDCKMTNTYKMSWCRSLVEWSVKNSEKNYVHFDDLSPLIFKYYWNQSIFFNLNQGSNPIEKPTIHQIVLKEIERYKLKYGNKPQVFSKIQNRIKIDIKKINNELKRYVWELFDKDEIFYKRSKGEPSIKLYHPELLSEYSDILFQLINYRWSRELEKINSSPRISMKILDGYREDIKRSTGLNRKFGKFIEYENPKKICFITGKPILNGDLSIDHVIPWSYIYSDDLWNLVFVSKSQNSSKGNRIPTETMIKKLERRNKRLLSLLRKNNITNNHTDQLEFSIEKNLVRNFWIGCKG